MWDVVAWNRAATVMLMDYGSPPTEKRGILRFIFGQHGSVAQIPAHADDFEECVLRAIWSALGTGA
jgi:MmyB-like transcription regulator ligand binding domain